jgi:opacity protein-like surface antigen
MLRKIILLASLVAVAPLAQAADNGIYLGAGYSTTDYDLDNPGNLQPFDDTDSGYKLIAGFRFLDSFGVEASYIDHGDATIPPGGDCGVPCPDTTRLSAQTLSAFAVGFLHFPVIDLFAKAGVTSASFDGRTPGFPDLNVSEDNTDFAWGGGVQAHFGSLGARLEYESFPVLDNQDVGAISLSFIYTFF